MSQRNNRATSVFLVDRSALQVLRAAQAAGVELPKASIRELADRAPLRNEVLSAIERIEERLPRLRLERPVHLLVGGSAHCRANAEYVSHRCSATLSRGSFYRLDQGIYVGTPPLAFVRAATGKASDVALLELGYELCGTYRTLATCGNSAYNVPALATAHEMRDYAARNSSLKGSAAARRLSALIADGSASPRETKLALLLGLPRRCGGYGLGMPTMNFEIEATREAMLIAHRASFRCDLCWPDAQVDVEYQSREAHSGESQRIDDSERKNALESMRWRVVEVTNAELDSMQSCDVIAKTVGAYLGKDMRIRVDGYHDRAMLLRAELGLQTDSWSARDRG